MEIEAEIKRQLTYLRSLQNYLAESSANAKDFQKIIEVFKNPIHRIVKLNCYQLLKTFPPNELASLELEKDFNSQDLEIQLCSLKLAFCLPIQNLMQIVKLHDSSFYNIIEGSFEFHFERIGAINSILMLLLTRETEVDALDMPKQAINNIYTKIAENCFNSNRDISANCILQLISFLRSKLQNQINLSYVKYDCTQIKNYLIPRIQLLKDKINSYEIRLRSKMMQLLVQLLQDSPQIISSMNTINQNTNTEIISLDLREFSYKLIENINENIIKNSLDLDIIIQSSECILSLMSHNQITNYFNCSLQVWNLFDNIDKFIRRIGYKKELNEILINILKASADSNTKIAISTRILEISSLVQNKLTRQLYMLFAFDNLVQCSMDLISQKKSSALLGLYNQTWFLSQLKDEPEELICTMIISVINTFKHKQILLELMDICNGTIWDGCNIEAIVMFLLLIEECTNIIPISELNLSDLINRLNTNQIGFMQKIQILLIITQKFTEQTLSTTLDYTSLLTELRTFLIQPISTPIYQITLIQNIYKILYYLQQNFHNQKNHLKSSILEILSDYNDNLIQRKNDQVAINLLEYNRFFIKSIQYTEKVDQQQLSLKIECVNNQQNQNLHLETLQIAFNIFQLKQFTTEQDSLIANLKALQKVKNNIFTQLELDSKLITGVSDFIQIYCSHVIDLQKSELCLGINVINNCPFQLDNLGIKILLDRNGSIQNNYKIIEELPSYQQHKLFFVVKVNPKHSMHFAFDVILQNVTTDQGQFHIRTQNYRISLMEFLIPNVFIHLSPSSLLYVQYEQNIVIQCVLVGSYLLLIKNLQKTSFALAVYDQANTQVFEYSVKQSLDQLSLNVSQTINIGLLAYQINGNMLTILISNISTIQDKNQVTVEVKSSSSCIDSCRREMDKLLYEMSEGMLQIIC